MSAIFIILIFIGCIGLILFVLVQNPKGGGLNSEFGSAVQLGGAKRATDILEKGTWGLAVLLAVVCLAMASPGEGTGESTEIEANPDSIEQFAEPDAGNELPAAPIGPGL